MSSILRPRIQFRRPKPPWGARLIRGHPMARGLALCLPFTEGGGDKVYDLSGNALTGTLTNMTPADWVPATSGFGLDFDGANDNILVGNHSVLEPVSTVTIAARVTPATGIQAAFAVIALQETESPRKSPWNSYKLGMDDNGTLYRFEYSVGGVLQLVPATTAPATGVTVDIMGVFDGTTGRVYIDGLLENTAGGAGSINYSGGEFRIGTNGAEGEAYQGNEEFVFVWNHAFTSREALEFHQNPYGMFKWPMVWGGAVIGGQVYYQSIAGVFTPAGITTKKTKTPKTGAITMSGVVIGKAKKVLAGVFTSSGDLAKKTSTFLAGVLTSVGVLAKKTSKTFAGVLTSAGVLGRKTAKVFTGAITFTGTSSRTMKFARTVLAGAVTFSGAVVKKVKRTLTGAFTSAGVLVSKAKKLLAGSLTPSGVTTKKTTKSFAGILTYVGTLTRTKVFHRVLTGAITFTGALTRKTGKVLTGAVTLAGAISRLTRKILSGALTFIGRVTGLAPVVAVHLTLDARSTDLTLKARSTDLTLEPRSTDLTLPSR